MKQTFRSLVLLSSIFLLVTAVDSCLNGLSFDMATPSDVSVPVWTCITVISFLGLFISVSLLFGRYAKWIYGVWLIWAFLYLCFAWWLHDSFHRGLSGEIIQMITTTNLEEIKGFVYGIGCRPMISSTLFLASIIWLLCLVINRTGYPRVTLRSATIGCVMVVFFVVVNVVAMPVIRSSIRVGYFYWPTLSAIQYHGLCEMSRKFARPGLPEKINSRFSNTPVNGILFIGESATRSRMGIYGYSGNTTPLLSRISSENLIAYTDLVGTAAGTVSSLRWLLSDADMCNNSGGGGKFI